MAPAVGGLPSSEVRRAPRAEGSRGWHRLAPRRRTGAMPDMPPLIIEAAINGATPKTRNPAVPRSPAEVAEDGLRCLAAGASIVHNHNDEPVVGGADGVHSPEPYIEAWRAIIAERPDALL